jgi:alanine-glyoxylate transaminase / serine-glyoxylate transaminase / serine-pyruvate transaminase
MTEQRPLLMIPGPIEISPGVLNAYQHPPKSHVSADIIEAFGSSLESMRHVWCADADAQPFILAGSGTAAMDMAVANLMEPGDRALLVNTGYFSERLAEMLRRRGAEVTSVTADVGKAPSLDSIRSALEEGSYKALFATHVDTSTGVRTDVEALAELAKQYDLVTVFDGVCATGAEEFEMSRWRADVYLTASQKALGLPPGLALLVASPRALATRDKLRTPPPMSLDWHQWLPIMKAYEGRRASYFATPATNLVAALAIGLDEICSSDCENRRGIAARVARHSRVANSFRAAWAAMDLSLLTGPGHVANTLSAIRYPQGVDATLLASIRQEGIIVAGGLHPTCKQEYFRVGHMGHTVFQEDWLRRTVAGLERSLIQNGLQLKPGVGLNAFEEAMSSQPA